MNIAVLILAHGLFWGGSNASAEDCVPPTFYTSLPRDDEWFYGVARDTDTEKARESAVRNLGKQVSGGIEGWDDRKIAEIAGPGQDRARVSDAVETVLSQTPLAGWEQDDDRRCNGYSYVLVRVQKEKAERFLAENTKFRNALFERLDKKITQIGSDLESMKAAYVRLAADLESLKQQQTQNHVSMQFQISRHHVEKIMGSVKDGLEQGKADADVQRKLLEAASVMADLKAEDIAALEKYEAAINFEASDASPESKAEKWQTLGREFASYAALSESKVEQWKQRAVQKKADDEFAAKRVIARDEDWSKLFRLLALTTTDETEKKKWAELFTDSYIESPGIEPWMAKKLLRFLPAGSKNKELEEIAGKLEKQSVLAPIKVDNKFGYSDRRGQVIIPARFDSADEFSEGLAAVGIKMNDRTCGIAFESRIFADCIESIRPKIGYINETGAMMIEPQFVSGSDFDSGMAVVGKPGGKCGFIDRTGRVLGEIQFNEVHPFAEGYAAVRMGGSRDSDSNYYSGGKWGYIDERGEIVIEPQFKEAGQFVGGIALVRTDSGFACIDHKANVVQSATIRQTLRGMTCDRQAPWPPKNANR